ncbi:hypothetical protein CUJ83_11530, partial [Methanocella sp. CWC-04]|nr:hypothetical protein [Methanocella sp. CWC-04]
KRPFSDKKSQKNQQTPQPSAYQPPKNTTTTNQTQKTQAREHWNHKILSDIKGTKALRIHSLNL